MLILQGTDSVLLFHAEMESKSPECGIGPASSSRKTSMAPDPSRYGTFLASRPSSMETDAIGMVIECCEAAGVRGAIQ